jgi:AcrR family transcriptional regulator
MARPRLVSDEDILAAVKKGVLEQGPAIPLDVIADRLNVTAPALLKRFKTRNALILAALAPPENPAFLDLMDSGPDARSFEPQLLEIIEGMTSFLAEVFPCMSALRDSGIPKEEMRTLFKQFNPLRTVEALSGWFTRADKKGLCEAPDPDAAAMMLMGATHMPMTIRHMLQHQSPKGANFELEGFTQTLARIVSRGLGASSTRTLHPRKRAS